MYLIVGENDIAIDLFFENCIFFPAPKRKVDAMNPIKGRMLKITTNHG
jgi:hypothetical protein